jgi:Fe-S-cluster containining protein
MRKRLQIMNEEFVIGKVEIAIEGEPLSFEMSVPKNKVKLSRMLPIFQQMTHSIVDIGVQKIESEGKEISCKKGCGACCNQLVPISEAEAFQIGELVAEMPEPRQSQIKQKFADACQHFNEIGWFKKVDKNNELNDDERRQLVLDYFAESILCPFLEDESCSIHQNRPLVCREYLVTSPAELCAKPTAEKIDRVKILFSVSEHFRKLEDNPKTISFLPLILALNWAENSPFERLEKTGQDWMADFFGRLTKK